MFSKIFISESYGVFDLRIYVLLAYMGTLDIYFYFLNFKLENKLA